MSPNREYFRPIAQVGPARPEHARTLAGGGCWFTDVEVLTRDRAARVMPAQALDSETLDRLTAPRANVAGLQMERPVVMGIVNATPDSFSNSGEHAESADAIRAGIAMNAAGAHMLDIGGESTRPGALTVDPQEEIRRTSPVIAGLRTAGVTCPVSIDTRKMTVAQAAIAAGGNLVNDVSGFTFDSALAPFCAQQGVPVCVMHALGDPATMQEDPTYDDVLLDVYDFLKAQITRLVEAGIPHDQIIADPGIGFGKTQVHNLALLARLSLFHGLGVPVLLGASRKRFIGNISGTEHAGDRAAGSIGVALAALAHGVQILRVHDVDQTVAAIALWQASLTGEVGR